MRCEMSGKEAPLFLVEIEGTKMWVAKEFTKYGKVLKNPGSRQNKQRSFTSTRSSGPEFEERIVTNYASLIKSAREKKGLVQKDLARQLNEKESLLHNVESGHMKPSVRLARKLGKFFHLTLIEEVKVHPEEESKQSFSPKPKSDVMTLGDFIKIKKR